MGRIVFNDEIVGEIDNGQLPMDNYAAVNYVDRVSCKEIISYLPDGTSRSFPLTMPVAQLNCQLSTVNCPLFQRSQRLLQINLRQLHVDLCVNLFRLGGQPCRLCFQDIAGGNDPFFEA